MAHACSPYSCPDTPRQCTKETSQRRFCESRLFLADYNQLDFIPALFLDSFTFDSTGTSRSLIKTGAQQAIKILVYILEPHSALLQRSLSTIPSSAEPKHFLPTSSTTTTFTIVTTSHSIISPADRPTPTTNLQLVVSGKTVKTSKMFFPLL